MKQLYVTVWMLLCMIVIADAKMTKTIESFDGYVTGKLPAGWVCADTGYLHPPAQWHIIDSGEKKYGKVLGIDRFDRRGRGRFNLCVDTKTNFKNGTISVMFKAVSGKIDQGGGIVWRYKDPADYYVIRYNPLESNLRYYVVKNGYRHQLCSADNLQASPGWHRIGMTQQGSVTKVFFDGKKMLECDDDTLKETGKAGVWSKADALTWFDRFEVEAK
jgi:hypothetical protein